jgi:hypothetical protein
VVRGGSGHVAALGHEEVGDLLPDHGVVHGRGPAGAVEGVLVALSSQGNECSA